MMVRAACMGSALMSVLLTTMAGSALGQQLPPPAPPAYPAPAMPPQASLQAPPAPAETGPRQPKRGDFDAGGQVRLPSGPDEMGAFATFNWVAFDLKGKYYLLDSVTASASMPLAIIKPDALMTGEHPSMFGGASVTLDAKLPKGPFASLMRYDTDVGLLLTGAYMREGAMLLSDKDYPLFVGDLQPGFSGGLRMKVKLGSLLDFSLVPVWVYQSGTSDSTRAVQVPMSLALALGSLVKVSADLGVFTGDDYSLRTTHGGRIYAGGALDVKLGPILVHGGAGTASLLTGGIYPSVRDAFYLDLNVKFAK
jgi:hypothetical protein